MFRVLPLFSSELTKLQQFRVLPLLQDPAFRV